MFSAAGDGGSYNFTVIPSAVEGSSKNYLQNFATGCFDFALG
jgi:hypothetical protein